MKELDLFRDLELGNIFEDITSKWQLKTAFKKVRSNKGSPGIDGQSIEKFEENLEEEINKLSKELETWTYKPSPVKRVEIPKAGGKGKRHLGIATVRDRVVQESIKMSIEWKIDENFSESSYGFRPRKSQHQAILKAEEYVKSGYIHVVDIDLEKFFDRIPQNRLMTKVSELIEDKRVVKLIAMILRSGILETTGLVVPSEEGTPQGSPISPLLSNIVLDELDKELERRNLRFCRFADDANIFCKSEKAANRVMVSITKFIEKRLKLKVNKDKSKVSKSNNVKFLGMTIAEDGIIISDKAIKRAFEKIKLLIPRKSGKSLRMTIEEVNKWFRGWYEYFRLTRYPTQFVKIEAHIRRRLRAKVVKQKKQKRILYRFLINKGIRKKTAYSSIYGGKRGAWSLSWSKAMHLAFPNVWFKDQGLFTPSENKLPYWNKLNQWIALT